MLQLRSNYEQEIKQLQKEINGLLDRLDSKPSKSNDHLTSKLRKMQEQDDAEIKRLLDDNSNLRTAI
jgi:hypothetical protein